MICENGKGSMKLMRTVLSFAAVIILLGHSTQVSWYVVAAEPELQSEVVCYTCRPIPT
jgi:hypothetical protein